MAYQEKIQGVRRGGLNIKFEDNGKMQRRDGVFIRFEGNKGIVIRNRNGRDLEHIKYDQIISITRNNVREKNGYYLKDEQINT